MITLSDKISALPCLVLILIGIVEISYCSDLTDENSKAKYVAENYTEIYYGGKHTQIEFASNKANKLLEQRAMVLGKNSVSYKQAVTALANLYDDVMRGKNWKIEPTNINLPIFDKFPEIDGKIGTNEWKSACHFYGGYPINSPTREEVEREWFCALHKDWLLIAAQFTDDHIVSYNNTKVDDMGGKPDHLYNGDAFELFIRPTNNSTHYYELLWNPEKTFWGMLHVPSPRGGIVTANSHIILNYRFAVNRTPKGYSFELAVSLKELYGWQNTEWKMMFVQVDRNANGEIKKTTPIPLLYDGHNTNGYFSAKSGNIYD